MRSSEIPTVRESRRRGEVLRAQLSAEMLVRIEKLAFEHGTDPRVLLEKAINLLERNLLKEKSPSKVEKDWGFGHEDLPDSDSGLMAMTDLEGPPVSVQVQALRQHDHEIPGDITSDF